nr:YgjP-like metallopeptidase domain-containing protein [Desulfonema limicola]
MKPKSSQVTVKGIHDKRPDIVLYINGIAIGVLELKRSTVSVTEGIRYGCIDTPEKHYLLCSLIHKFGRKEEAGYDEYIRPDSSTEKRQKIMKEWYRVLIKEQIPPILEKYERKTGIKSNSWAVKHMKTKWGSCNMRTDAYG